MPSTQGSLSAEGQLLTRVLIAPATQLGSFQGEFEALIDTGATKTCITRTVVEQLGMVPHSRILVATPSGLERRKAYSFSLGFLSEAGTGVGSTRSPFYFPDAISGADFVKNSNFDVLLGMDVLRRGRLLVEVDRFSFSF